MIVKPNILAQLFYYVGSYQLKLEDGQLKRELKTLWFFKRKHKFLNSDKIIVFDTEIGLLGNKIITGYIKRDKFEKIHKNLIQTFIQAANDQNKIGLNTEKVN
jgi:hypothetical protein